MSVKMANGMKIGRTNFPQSTHPARRFAAALPRDHPPVDRIVATRNGDVTVWLTPDAGTESIHAPEGWTFKKAFVSSAGDIAIRFKEADR